MDSEFDLDSHKSIGEKNLFLILLLILNIVGMVMVYSSSYIYAKDIHSNPTYFVFKQFTYLMISISVAFVISKTKFEFWLKYSYFINFAMTVVVALTFVPGVGVMVKGASRWIQLGGYSFQPGEMIKYTVLLSALAYFESFKTYTPKQRIGLGLLTILPLILIIAQPDYGTFMICGMGIFFACYMSSFSRKIFYGLIPIGLSLGVGLLLAQPYRVERLKTFLDPWQSPQGSGFQIIQSWMGFANGGLFGKGLGNSYEKLFYLPEAHNDFILSVLGEELGFIGVCFMVILYLGLIFLGFRLSLHIANRRASLAASSLIFTIGIQSLLNMSVVLGLLPTKGLNLPFISYGGSSLLSNFFAVGLFLSFVGKSEDDSYPEINEAPAQNEDFNQRFQRFREQRGDWQSKDSVGQSPFSRL